MMRGASIDRVAVTSARPRSVTSRTSRRILGRCSLFAGFVVGGWIAFGLAGSPSAAADPIGSAVGVAEAGEAGDSQSTVSNDGGLGPVIALGDPVVAALTADSASGATLLGQDEGGDRAADQDDAATDAGSGVLDAADPITEDESSLIPAPSSDAVKSPAAGSKEQAPMAVTATATADSHRVPTVEDQQDSASDNARGESRPVDAGAGTPRIIGSVRRTDVSENAKLIVAQPVSRANGPDRASIEAPAATSSGRSAVAVTTDRLSGQGGSSDRDAKTVGEQHVSSPPAPRGAERTESARMVRSQDAVSGHGSAVPGAIERIDPHKLISVVGLDALIDPKDALGRVTAPIVAPVSSALVPVTAPVAERLAPVTVPLTAPLNRAIKPVRQALGGVIDEVAPVTAVVRQTVSPVVEVVAGTVLSPVARVAAPAGKSAATIVVEPMAQVAKPVVDTVAPIEIEAVDTVVAPVVHPVAGIVGSVGTDVVKPVVSAVPVSSVVSTLRPAAESVAGLTTTVTGFSEAVEPVATDEPGAAVVGQSDWNLVGSNATGHDESGLALATAGGLQTVLEPVAGNAFPDPDQAVGLGGQVFAQLPNPPVGPAVTSPSHQPQGVNATGREFAPGAVFESSFGGAEQHLARSTGSSTAMGSSNDRTAASTSSAAATTHLDSGTARASMSAVTVSYRAGSTDPSPAGTPTSPTAPSAPPAPAGAAGGNSSVGGAGAASGAAVTPADRWNVDLDTLGLSGHDGEWSLRSYADEPPTSPA